MCTWKESCQLKFFTWVSSLTLMAEWFNLCKYLTHESRLRWEGGLGDSAQTVGTTVFKVTVCNCLSAAFKELRLARHPPSCEFAEKKTSKGNFSALWGKQWLKPGNKQAVRRHKQESQEQSCSHAWHGRAGISVHQRGASQPCKWWFC